MTSCASFHEEPVPALGPARARQRFNGAPDSLVDGLGRFCDACARWLAEDVTDPDGLAADNLFSGEYEHPARPGVPDDWRVAPWEGAEAHPLSDRPRFRIFVDHDGRGVGSSNRSPRLFTWWVRHVYRVAVCRPLIDAHGRDGAADRIGEVQRRVDGAGLGAPYLELLLRTVYEALESAKEAADHDGPANRRFGTTPGWLADLEVGDLRSRWPGRFDGARGWQHHRRTASGISVQGATLTRPYYPGFNALLLVLEDRYSAASDLSGRGVRDKLVALLELLDCPQPGTTRPGTTWSRDAIRRRVAPLRKLNPSVK